MFHNTWSHSLGLPNTYSALCSSLCLAEFVRCVHREVISDWHRHFGLTVNHRRINIGTSVVYGDYRLPYYACKNPKAKFRRQTWKDLRFVLETGEREGCSDLFLNTQLPQEYSLADVIRCVISTALRSEVSSSKETKTAKFSSWNVHRNRDLKSSI